MLVFIVILSMTTLLKKFSLWYILCALLGSCILAMIRLPMGSSVIALFFIFYLVFVAKEDNRLPYVLAGILVALIGFKILSQNSAFTWATDVMFAKGHFDKNVFLERLSISRSLRAYGGSAILPNFSYNTPLKLLLFVPIGIAIVFFMPFPWQLGSALQLMAAPEMLLWYALFPLTVSGFIYCLKKDRSQTLIIIACALILSTVLGVAEGNVGTLFRHRSAIFGLCLVFTGAGVALKRKVLE